MTGVFSVATPPPVGGPNTFWLPITDADRAMNAPVVEKDAGVEALFWRVAVLDYTRGQDVERELRKYVRLKVFNERGKEKIATVDLEVPRGSTVDNIVGRTIKADGTIVELTRDAVHERDIVRIGRRKFHVKSFAMPAVEPGAIVEYRWREVRMHDPMLYLRIEMQHEFPIQHMIYQIKPLEEIAAYRASFMPFNCAPTQPTPQMDGFSLVTLDNVAAYHDEPMMPSPPNVRPWALMFYHQDARREPEKYWVEIGKKHYSALKSALHADDQIKSAAAKAIEGATTDEEKTLALIRYIRKDLRLLWDRRVTEEERSEVLKHMPKDRERTSVEVFRSRIGTADELNTLFAAMAAAVGLEARPAFAASRNELHFDPKLLDQYFLRNIDMAVRIGDQWRIFDVSTRRLPADMLSWQEERVTALVTSPKKPEFVETGVALPEASSIVRTAKFELALDGTLDGEVDMSYSGHNAEIERSDYEDQTEARQQEMVKEHVTKIFSQAEVTAIRVQNFDDPEQPLRIQYHVKLPQYAQRTSKRLLLQPLYFQRGEAPLFEATDRRYDISFPYAWKEMDNVTIHCPAGFALDSVETPGSFEFGATGYYHLEMKADKTVELTYHRELVFGRQGLLLTSRQSYPQLKNLFDLIHGRDQFSIALRQIATGQASK
jgi:hypothetical protein